MKHIRWIVIGLLIIIVARSLIAGDFFGAATCHLADQDGWIVHRDSTHADSNTTRDTCDNIGEISPHYALYLFEWQLTAADTGLLYRMCTDSAAVMLDFQSSTNKTKWNHVWRDSLDTVGVWHQRYVWNRPAGGANDTVFGKYWRSIATVKTYDLDTMLIDSVTASYDSVKLDTRIQARD